MARDGSGTYNRTQSDYSANTTILSAEINSELNDMATALTQSIAKDGQTPASATIPFASGIKTNTIQENAAGSGVAIDGKITIKDGTIIFEGATDDAFELTLQVTDPTADRTITLPDDSGTVALSGGGGALQNIVEDTTPQLGGDLDLNGFNLDFPTTANISDVLDEDNMVSNSATALATQQSIKAYVDSGAGGIGSLVEDTTPQLGGDLDLNGRNIDFPTTANISDCLDEDTMSSNSATALATQQSIKAYVDAESGIGSDQFATDVDTESINGSSNEDLTNTEMYDPGNDYNPTTGEYTAPTTGHYACWANFRMGGSGCDVQFKVNGTLTGPRFTNDDTAHEKTAFAVFSVSSGQTIECNCQNLSGSVQTATTQWGAYRLN